MPPVFKCQSPGRSFAPNVSHRIRPNLTRSGKLAGTGLKVRERQWRTLDKSRTGIARKAAQQEQGVEIQIAGLTLRRAIGRGQCEAKRRAAAGDAFAFGPDTPAVRFDDMFGNR